MEYLLTVITEGGKVRLLQSGTAPDGICVIAGSTRPGRDRAALDRYTLDGKPVQAGTVRHSRKE